MEYHCRDCPQPVRALCIQESGQPPSTKQIMVRAFEAGTDTEWMWAQLQMNCLRRRWEQQSGAPTTHRQSLLSSRLRGAPKPAAPAEKPAGAAPPKITAPPPPPAPSAPRAAPLREPARPSPPEPYEPIRLPSPEQLRRAEDRKKESIPLRYGLVMQGGQHRIALPMDGEIVLGRFDLATQTAPDVDLSYNDRDYYAVSRRHARVTGQNGIHDVEDMGSTNGTRVNDFRLRVGQKTRLRPGDRVAFGYCEFTYEPISEMEAAGSAQPPPARLWVSFTGQRIPLPGWGELIVGRSDPTLKFTPDIDLSNAGESSQVVARRHVKIIARGGRHYVEDLGSAAGTKVNGVPIKLGELRLLSPGDHLWLGGCVLAYDIES